MKYFLILTSLFLLTGCNNDKTKKEVRSSDLVIMTPQGKNLCLIKDTLVIYEMVCRGCEYEQSTQFAISDSLNLAKIVNIETIDKNSPDMAGGSIDKHIYLVPVKPGKTKLKVYKFNTESRTAQDSLAFTYYDLEIKE